ncbi:hypothetical protein SEPCBS119000_006384 [Sporothrix epigloea]|uniref:ADP-ribosylation factor GTPase-activating protein n=1 Tax=Sporothrix epigloea TaxID=1892477 RepID=A0ABP0E353_9PEZI
MGITASRPDEGVVFFRDQNRLSISSLVITSARRRTSVNIAPNAFPATRFSATRSLGDNAPLEFVQDTGSSSAASGPQFLLKLPNDEELTFTFTFVIRQTPTIENPPNSLNASNNAAAAAAGTATTASSSPPIGTSAPAAPAATATTSPEPRAGAADATASSTVDTVINGLTFVQASNLREVENLLTREFDADPNLHKNSNVELVGDFTTGGSPSVTFDWSWQWKPPRTLEDKGGGWRNSCSFVEYDQRAHRLETLASFSFYVSNSSNIAPVHPSSPTPSLFLGAPPRIRVASAQSVDSRISSNNEAAEEAPNSPQTVFPDASGFLTATQAQPPIPAIASTLTPVLEPVKVDVSCPRPGDDVSVADDGPLFRATIKALEQKTGNMRMQMKKVIKRAEHAYATMVDSNEAFSSFMDALKETSSTNANAVQPAIDHYFDKIAREILTYERQNTFNLQRIIIDPLTKLYTMDIKQAEAKKRDFEEESKDYYAYVGRYLGQRHDNLKTKKLAESDTKYQTKRRNFELKRFDYSSFMQDLSGGRKEQEVLSHLTRYADSQAKSFLNAAKKVDGLLPQLEALSNEVQLANKEYQYRRREREEKRRYLEKSNGLSSSAPTTDSDNYSTAPAVTSNGIGIVNKANTNTKPISIAPTAATTTQSIMDTDLGRADSTGSQMRAGSAGTVDAASGNPSRLSASLGSTHHVIVGSPPQNHKFKGIRDLEERDQSQASALEKTDSQRKEGLLWALNRPGSHVDPRSALNKQGWHKFWIVLDQGKLSEYSNWKQKLDLHMDPIDLRMASVREARNAERRFTFEVITPHYKRVYQATSEEDMNSWIASINNALQSAMEGRDYEKPAPAVSSDNGSSSFPNRDIGSMFTGKSTSLSHGHRGRDGHGISAVGGAVANALTGGSSSSSRGNTGIPSRRITVGGRPSAPRAASSSYEENPGKLLQMLRDADQGNAYCADCGSTAKVEWVSINLAIILCIECSGIHRSLGTHISKVRSLTLDINSFTTDIIELLMLVGNRVANMIWEARLDPAAKLAPTANREQRLRYITSKYVDHVFVEPISTTLSHYSTADETLLASVKKNDIQQVIYALALKANPNAVDLSRGTHVVFLALAAADPASPSPVPPPSPSPSQSGTSRPGTSGSMIAAAEPKSKPVSFPVAELLLQNGAQIPATLPAFPLSQSAQHFLEAKRGRIGAGLNIAQDGSSSTSSVSSIGSGISGASSMSPSVSSGAGAMERMAREKEARLQKRLSAGGRLARSPIPER